MDNNLKIILSEFEKFKGQFVIADNHKIERLVAIGDAEDDYYYITYDGRKINWNSCVGRIMPLKGFLQDKDYNELVRLSKLNHFDSIGIDFFNKWFKNWKNDLPDNYTFHTDFCFDTTTI
jgi:hypothetical protein